MSRDLALLTNPASGRGRGGRAREAVRQRLADAGFAVRDIVGRDAPQALGMAREAVADGVEALVVIGGDGTVHLGVQAVAGTTCALGVIPMGTGNDVARYLRIPRKDPIAAADLVIGGATRTIDLARCHDGAETRFVTVLAAGFDAVVNERANRMRWPSGQSRYHLAILAELRTFRPIRYRLDLDGVRRDLDAMLVAVGNGPSYGGGLRLTEGADLTDGLLDVVIIKAISRPDLVRTYPKLYTGGHTRHPAYERHRVREVRVAAEGIVAYADGERLGPLPVSITCEPAALTIFTPRAREPRAREPREEHA